MDSLVYLLGVSWGGGHYCTFWKLQCTNSPQWLIPNHGARMEIVGPSAKPPCIGQAVY